MLKPREDCRLINGTLNKLERDWRKNKNLLTLYWQASVVSKPIKRQSGEMTCVCSLPLQIISGSCTSHPSAPRTGAEQKQTMQDKMQQNGEKCLSNNDTYVRFMVDGIISV